MLPMGFQDTRELLSLFTVADDFIGLVEIAVNSSGIFNWHNT